MGNALGCSSIDQGDVSPNKQLVSTRKPPVQCEGYSPAIIPTFLNSQEIVDFYLSFQDESAHETRQLACSLIRCIKNDTGTSTTADHDRSQWTKVQTFDIDSTKPVIILCHGFMSWRNQMLLAFLAANLSRKLNCHTLRFDFSGNGHSNGSWHYGGYDIEARDLQQVIRFVREQMKCQVSCVIGHSKGAFSVFRRAWEQEGLPAHDRIPCFVNLCGSYYVPNTYSAQERFTKEQFAELQKTGKILMETRGQRRYEVTMADIEEKTRLDSAYVQLIATSYVLTIHGDADNVVNVSSAHKFSDAIKPRHHDLKIIKGGDHAFNGLKHMDELTDTITTFVRKRS